LDTGVAELHPMAVHLPIGLLLLYPFLELGAALARRRAVEVVALSVLGVAVVASLVASTSGDAAYDAAIDAGYEHGVLEPHEELAELVPWLLILLFAARLYLALKTSFGAWVGVALGAGMVAFIIRVGATGGELVYEHGVGVRPGAGPVTDPRAEPAPAYEDEAEEDTRAPHDGPPRSGGARPPDAEAAAR
jgi:uncharacterized membrane protein